MNLLCHSQYYLREGSLLYDTGKSFGTVERRGIVVCQAWSECKKKIGVRVWWDTGSSQTYARASLIECL